MAHSDTNDRPHRAGVFDIRTFIGALLGVYGVILVLTGIIGTSDAELAKDEGFNINLWAGIALLVAAVVMIAWARLRPVVVPAHHEQQGEPGTPGA